MKVIQKFALVVALLASPAALPCSFDTDCDPGSKCLQRSGSIDGVCAGGISPGNRSDRQPVKAPLDINRTYGNTCSFNTDCGSGSVCEKSSGIYGVCLKR